MFYYLLVVMFLLTPNAFAQGSDNFDDFEATDADFSSDESLKNSTPTDTP